MARTPSILLTLTLCAGSAGASIDVNLPGNSTESTWANMTSANYPGYPAPQFSPPGSNTAWPAPIAPDSGSASFDKVFGTGTPFSTSIYNGTLASTYTITQSTPLSGLETIIFQTDMGDAFTAAPVINFNGGSQSLLADFTALTPGQFSGMGVPSTNRAFQWDVSTFSPITEYEILWTTTPHNANYAMQLTEGDTFSQVIPEPSTYALIAGIGCGGLILLRRKRS